ncbi:MAG TPA: TetR family transcriptional regulator, partial [Solirubrobacteraceae bacterium]
MATRPLTKVPSRRGGKSPRVHVSEMQRARLLSAAVLTVEELGWSGASVAHITSRARVSRRTFYDLFENREDCLLAILDDVVERVAGELAVASMEGLPWRERVRAGLWTILCFLDREPVLAGVCVVQALQGGSRVLERREEILGRLAVVLDEGRGGAGGAACPSLTAEGLVGATFSIVYARLMRGERERGPLGDLLGELMGMIVLPYLGARAAGREQALPLPVVAVPARAAQERHAASVVERDPLRGVPMRLTYRTVRVLEVIGANPGVSNRVVGELAGVADQGQISKLLARLERLGLIENTGAGHARGEVNSWSL